MTHTKLLLMAAATLAFGLSGCASMRLNGVADDLRTALKGEPVEVANQDGAIKITSSSDRIFPSGGYQLNPGAPILSKMVPIFVKLQHTNITVNGYTDNVPVGPELKAAGVNNNLELSYRRADAAVSYFRSQGVNNNLLSYKGLGESDPVASNDTPEGRAKNRRIEIILTGDGT